MGVVCKLKQFGIENNVVGVFGWKINIGIVMCVWGVFDCEYSLDMREKEKEKKREIETKMKEENTWEEKKRDRKRNVLQQKGRNLTKILKKKHKLA